MGISSLSLPSASGDALFERSERLLDMTGARDGDTW